MSERRKPKVPSQELSVELEAVRELQRTQHALACCHRDMERLAAAISHDLLAPLRAVRSFAELLESREGAELSATASRYLAHIVSGAARGQGLVADLVAFAREGAGEYAPMVPVSLGDVVRLALSDLDEDLRAVEAQTTVGELPQVHGNREALRRVVRELLSNCIRFRSPERPLRIELRSLARAEENVVQVDDNGIGFPDQHSQHVFELFRTLHTAREYPGSGLGLALVRRTMERHGGGACAAGRDGTGCTISLSFPCFSELSLRRVLRASKPSGLPGLGPGLRDRQ